MLTVQINNFIQAAGLLVLGVLMAIHLWNGALFWRRLRAGHNGVTLALMLHTLALSQMFGVQMVGLVLITAPTPGMSLVIQLATLFTGIIVLISGLGLIVSARLEAQRAIEAREEFKRKLEEKTYPGLKMIYDRLEGEEK